MTEGREGAHIVVGSLTDWLGVVDHWLLVQDCRLGHRLLDLLQKTNESSTVLVLNIRTQVVFTMFTSTVCCKGTIITPF